jgi:hypothetical protein
MFSEANINDRDDIESELSPEFCKQVDELVDIFLHDAPNIISMGPLDLDNPDLLVLNITVGLVAPDQPHETYVRDKFIRHPDNWKLR